MPVKQFSLVCAVSAMCAACVPSENDIRTEVRDRLAADQTTAGLALSVDVRNRVVYLSGKTATEAEQQQALLLAQGARGVKFVVSDMWLNNAALADKVKAALAADELVGRTPIEVDANGATVRLMSDQTNREERVRAVQIASAVEGVTQVEDRMK